MSPQLKKKNTYKKPSVGTLLLNFRCLHLILSLFPLNIPTKWRRDFMLSSTTVLLLCNSSFVPLFRSLISSHIAHTAAHSSDHWTSQHRHRSERDIQQIWSSDVYVVYVDFLWRNYCYCPVLINDLFA